METNKSATRELCSACKSKLNVGASRCANCGQHIGKLGTFYSTSSVIGAVLAITSLVTVAISLYIDVLKPRKADLVISFTDATFQKITNLTCDALDGNTSLMVPRFNGDTPGNEILIEGIISNSGNVAGQLRILNGHMRLLSTENEFSAPLAGIGEPIGNSRFLVEPNTTISFSVSSPIGRINSDGAYVAEVNLPVPPPNGRIIYSRDILAINYITYNNGISNEHSAEQAIDFFMEPFSENWKVDGTKYPENFLCQKEGNK